MNCRNVENNLSGYIENSLTPSLMLEVKDHIEGCTTCKYLYLQVKNTYEIFDNQKNNLVPDLYPGIAQKLKHHHTAVVEFVPRHQVLYKLVASIIIVIGIGFGIFVGGNYTSAKLISSQSNTTDEATEIYTIVANSIDEESGLAMLYSNE